MSRFRRFVVLLLVALALPLQALAAAAMLHCQPAVGDTGARMHRHADGTVAHDMHRAGAAAAPHAADHHHPAGHPHAADHEHAADLSHAADHPPIAADADREPPPGAAHACSACAACCTMAGVPPRLPGVAAPERAPEVLPERAPPAVLFLTSGLERPPRARA